MNNKIYISGPITGVKDYKYVFKDARFRLEEARRICSYGHKCRKQECLYYNRDYILGCMINRVFPDYPEIINPAEFKLDGCSWHVCMLVCIARLLPCSYVYMLWGWQQSRGARIEHKIAKLLGKRVIYEKRF